jgi:hypothetical protein
MTAIGIRGNLFGAMSSPHSTRPVVPRPKPADDAPQLIPTLLRRAERLEARLKLLEEEQKGAIDLTKLYKKPSQPGSFDNSE